VEKLQTISTKFRQQQKGKQFLPNFLRHYYHVDSLLERPEVQTIIGAADYTADKARRFCNLGNKNIAKNEALPSGNAEGIYRDVRKNERSGNWCGRWDSNPHDVAIEGF
jgi:hypothetical protein